jgi:hypothetical protein
MTTITPRRSPFHILSHGRRVAKRDEDLFRLIEFANVLTPRGGESAKDALEIRVTNFLGDPWSYSNYKGRLKNMPGVRLAASWANCAPCGKRVRLGVSSQANF